MSAACVPWHVVCGNTSLARNGDPVCPHLCPVNHNLAHVRGEGWSMALGSLFTVGGGMPLGHWHSANAISETR